MIRYFFRFNPLLFLTMGLWLGISPGFAQEPAKSDVPAAEDSQKPPNPVKRDSPLKTLFDQSSAQVEVVADSIEYQKATDKVIARGNAVLTYKNMQLLADYAELETATKKAYAKGHVLVFENGEPTAKGNEVFYDFEKHTGSFPNGRSYNKPWFGRGQEIKQVKEGEIKVIKGGVTTCNLESPHYEIRCKKATIYSGVKIRMWNATIYVLGKPVFWWPYLVFPLNWNMPFDAKAGSTTEYGAYIELTKGITFNKYLSGRWHADWRAKRGFGGGWDQDYNFEKYAKGDVKLYLTRDKRAPTPGFYTPEGALNPYGQREARYRGRVTWRHRTDINDYTHVILRYHRVADQYFLQDFTEGEFRSEMEPHSFMTATHNGERYGTMIHVEKRMNSYENIIERQPEVRLDWKNQPFFTDKLYNVTRLQFDNMSKKIGTPGTQQDAQAKAFRVDGNTLFTCPMKYKEIKLTPSIGYRGTEYSRQATTNSAKYRQIFEYGADLRTQAYRTMNVTFDKAGIEVNQLRHIFEPNVRVQGQQSTTDFKRLTHFDTVDRLDSSSEIVFGMDNRLQTKRMIRGKAQRVDLVSFNTYVHYAFKPADPKLSGGGFTLLEGELTLRPYEWLQFQSRMEIDLARHYIKLCNNDIIIRKGRFRLLFGQRYVHDQYEYQQDLVIPEAMQFVVDGQFKINDLWSVGGYIRWTTSGKQEGGVGSLDNLQEWQISATRDLHDFILDFGFNQRNSLINSNNRQLFFAFRMKAFPQFSLPFGTGGGASFSEPRIGETVEGASQDRGRYAISKESQFGFQP